MNNFPTFVEPILINGKMFEKSDVPGVVECVSRQLCAAQSRPAEQKKSAAKFLLAAEQSGAARLQNNIRSYCRMLIK